VTKTSRFVTTRAIRIALVAGLAVVAPSGVLASGTSVQDTTIEMVTHGDVVTLDNDLQHVGAGASAFGDAVDHGSLSGAALAQPVVGMASTPAGSGYWLVARDGGVFSFGDAPFYGSTGAITLNQPIVGIASTPSGHGYWLVASDGGVFSFGDARFFGSTGAITLNQPIVGVAATPSGNGYWLVARDGGVFSFGDAQFHGSTGGMTLLQPITGGASSPSGHGYWLVAADGGVFTFGDAPFHGSDGGGGLGQAVVSMASTADGTGYWLAGAGGSVGAHGSAPGYQPAWTPAPVVGMARTPSGHGYWLATAAGGVLSGASTPGPGADSYKFLANQASGAPVRYNPCSVIRYVINPAGAPSGGAGGVNEVKAAFDGLAAMSGLSFQFVGETSETHITIGSGYRSAAQNGQWSPILVSWASASQEPLLAGSVLGYGGSTSVSASGYDTAYVTGEVVLDRDLSGLAPGFGSGATRGNLLLHEIGHLVGLDHVGDLAQLMYPALSNSSPSGYGAGDRNGLARLGAASGCLHPYPAS
jgi:ribosomal protein L24E